VAISDALPLKATQCDANTKLKSFWGCQYELQTKPLPFHLDSLCSATLMVLRVCAMDWGWNRILRVGKNSSPILNHLWTNAHDILGQCRGLLIASNAFAQLSVIFCSEDICH